MKQLFLLLPLALLLCACDNNFTLPSEVEWPRLIGVRVEPEGDVERAWPRVGEDFTLRWRVARKGKPSDLPLDEQLTAGIAICAGAVLPTGSLFCAQEFDLDELGLKKPNIVPNSDDLEMPLTLPFDPKMFGLDRVLLFGAICVDGEVERVKDKKVGEDPASELYRCKNNGDAEFKTPLAFTSSFFVDDEEDDVPANRHPLFACDADEPNGLCAKGKKHDGEERLGGSFVIALPNDDENSTRDKKVVAWPASTVPADELPWKDCKDADDLLQVRAGSKEHVIRVRFDPSDRETYEATELVNDKPVLRKKREELQIAHAASKGGGQLARYFSVIARNAEDDEAELELEYLPPEADSEEANDIPAGGMLVRFHFVARDQRGGVDFTTRELCLLRPKVVN